MTQPLQDWQIERERLNEKLLATDNLNLKRFFGLDSAVYRSGALPSKTKEALGLSCSVVLRCDDCITYHVIRCCEEGMTTEEFEEIIAIALVVGGSITIPHIRRARENWELALQTREQSEQSEQSEQDK